MGRCTRPTSADRTAMGALGGEVDLVDLVVRTRELGGRCVVEADGDLDMFDAPVLRGHLQRALALGGGRHLVVDLRCVDFLGSSGLAVLVEALKEAEAAGGSLALVCNQHRIVLVLELTGLLDRFAVYPSLDEALTAGPHAGPQ
jgi:anti-sigma B factor antagonist